MTNPSSPWILRPSAFVSPDGGPERIPPRTPDLQEPGYLAKYDARTVFYDVFRCDRKVLAIGPPAGSLAPVVAAAQLQGGLDARPTGFAAEPGLDRVGRFWAVPQRGSRGLSVVSPLLPGPLAVGDDLASRFAGRRAVMTISKDNDLDWIDFWGRWYAHRHGADALVIYDNGSSAYSLEELWETLAGVPGIKVAAVVDWPFRFGPTGRPPRPIFDSDYAQHGALEHARWRLLRAAAGFLNTDIDELVLDPDGRSVFEAAALAPSGAVSFTGIWTYPDPDTPKDRRPQHADAYWVKALPPDAASPPKLCVVPGRLPASAQVMIHKVRGVRAVRPEGFRFAHLMNISTNWYGGRNEFHVSDDRFLVDDELKARFDDTIEPIPPTPGRRPPPASRLLAVPGQVLAFGWRLRERLRDLRRR